MPGPRLDGAPDPVVEHHHDLTTVLELWRGLKQVVRRVHDHHDRRVVIATGQLVAGGGVLGDHEVTRRGQLLAAERGNPLLARELSRLTAVR